MAKGTQRAADSVSEQTGLKLQDYGVDQLAVILVSDTFAASADFINISQFTQVSTGGTEYTGAKNTTGTWTRSALSDITSLQAGTVQWGQDPAGPTNIQCAVLHNTAAGAVGNGDVITVVDLTDDNGITPVSLVAGALNVNFANSVTMTVQRQ